MLTGLNELDQRLITQSSVHGMLPSGVDAALIGLHPVLQYGLCAAIDPLKSLMALALRA
jgi:hypothetical protein